MPITKDKLWIQRSDLNDFKEFSANITDAEVDKLITEAQTVEIRGFLGDVLYNTMQSDWTGTAFATPKFESLWFGVVNEFNGLAMAHVYFAYARLLRSKFVSLDRFGVSRLENDATQIAESTRVRSAESDARAMAIYYQTKANEYLQNDRANWPEYFRETTSGDSTSFRFFKV
jgi:hypothetical protein